MTRKKSSMKNVLLLLLLSGLGLTALVIGLACSANPTGPNFQTPLQTVQAGNPSLTPTVTYTFTMTFTITPTPTNSATPLPVVTTTWDNGFGSNNFKNPSAITVQNGSQVYVYVADTGNSRVEKFTNTGSLVTSWGAGGKGKGTVNFPTPQAVAVNSSGILYVAGPSGIGVFDANGNYLTTYINPGTGSFNDPKGLALDGSGNLFVSDTGNQRIVELANNGTPESFGSIGGVTVTGLSPTGLVVDSSENVYVALNNATVEEFNSGGSSALTILGFNNPDGLALDSTGDLFVADTGNKTVEEFPVPTPFQSPSVLIDPNNVLVSPVGVAVDSTGEIYVVDSKGNNGNGTVYNFAP